MKKTTKEQIKMATIINGKEVSAKVKEQVAEQRLQPVAALNESVEMTPEEYRAMIELAKNAGPEDCEMCGS